MDLKQHFTKAPDLNLLMAKLLGNVQDYLLLEPSVGEGSLLENIEGFPKEIHAFDVDDKPIQKWIERGIGKIELKFINNCFIKNYLKNKKTDNYDAVISNPPYGLDFSIEYRKYLKENFPNIYVKESYSLFFYISLMQLKRNGRYVFLLPDTFLTSHRHRAIRNFLVDEARPTHIIRMPSEAFETVNFKYANLCVIAGYKNPLKQSDTIEWSVLNSLKDKKKCLKISGDKFIKNIDNGWGEHYLIDENKTKGWVLLGDIASCKTGIYTGENSKYIGFNPSTSKRKSNAHPIFWDKNVCDTELNECEKVNGLEKKNLYVPFVRGGYRSIFEKPLNAILWDIETVSFYKKNKKSRFQNSDFYFREGIAVPMVSSSKISASYMKNCVFDQGVVGVFPNNKNILNILLLYLNSSFASKIMKSMVNNSPNNSANYLKKLPVPNFDLEAEEIADNLIRKIKNTGSHRVDEIDNFIESYI